MATKFKREFKNVVYNYTDAEAKVREATSNDPWGPSSAVMAELADYTFHVEAYSLVMGMLWKRLNDHGKNWRHVYKALVVLEYLIKAGSERVHQQCKENLFSIQTLKDFQYMDKDGKDQGTIIREKAKNMVALLKDESRLKDERRRAKQAKDRHGGIGSDGTVSGSPQGTPKGNKRVQINEPSDGVSPDSLKPGQKYIQPVEQARPNDTNEEDLQLKLAIELSKQQAEQDKIILEQEEQSLKAALEMSKTDCNGDQETEGDGEADAGGEASGGEASGGGDLLLDFSNTGLGDPWSTSSTEPPPPSYDMVATGVGGNSTLDPWGATAPPPSANQGLGDPWGAPTASMPTPMPTASLGPQSSAGLVDPWSTTTSSLAPTSMGSDPMGSFGVPPTSSMGPSPNMSMDSAPPASIGQQNPTSSFNPFDLSTLDSNLPSTASIPFSFSSTDSASQPKRVEDDFLGELAQLVNLDSLTNPAQQQPKSTFGPSPSNPFGTGVSSGPPKSNPFETTKPAAPSLNQLAEANKPVSMQSQLPTPLQPTSTPNAFPTTNGNASYNPFS